jgi:penicillin-binding protein 1C
MVHLDKTGRWQVHSGCEPVGEIQNISWFVLPPVQEWYFRNKNPFYRLLPPFKPGCAENNPRKNMEMIYPKNNSRIYLPVDLDGTPGKIVLRLAHRSQGTAVYWHLDDEFISVTRQNHQTAISAPPGFHRLTLIDQNGETLSLRFEILSSEKSSKKH